MRRPVRDDAGTTLAETLVASMLLVLALALTATLFVAGQRSALATQSRVEAQEQQRVAFDAVPRLLRTATPVGEPARPAVVSAGPREITFYANTTPGTAPPLVRLVADPATRTLRQETTPAGAWNATTGTYTYAPGTMRSRVLARDVSVTTTTTAFRYLEARSSTCAAALGCPLTPVTTGSTTALVPADAAKVRSILVNLTVAAPGVRTGSTVDLRSRVQLVSTRPVVG
jgi:type II secretory pathway component PulJ